MNQIPTKSYWKYMIQEEAIKSKEHQIMVLKEYNENMSELSSMKSDKDSFFDRKLSDEDLFLN